MLLTYLSFVVAAATGSVAPSGETAPRPVDIELEAPEGCSGADAFFRSLRSRTDRVRRADGNEPHTTLQVRLTRTRGQVVGELRMVDDHGGTDSRKVEGASCEDVVQALSLTAALALDPSAQVPVPATAPAALSAGAAGTAAANIAATGIATAGTAPAGTAAAGSTTAGTATAGTATAGTAAAGTAAASATRTGAARPDAHAPAEAARSDEAVAEISAPPSPRAMRPLPVVELSLGPIGVMVLSGSYSTGVELGVRKPLRGAGVFRPTLGLTVSYTRNDVVQSPQVAQASLAALAATVCPLRWTASILTVEPCAHLLGGWLSATGRDVNHPNTINRLWLSAGGSLRTAASIGGGFSVELEAGVSAPLLKRRFYYLSAPDRTAENPTLSPIVGLHLTYGLQYASPDGSSP